MDLEKVKAQIAELKDKAVDNVERHFNNEILLDIFDSGELDIIDKPIDDNDWYLYWKEQSYDLREIFYSLFKEEQDKTFDNLLNDCMELKKVIDKNLISNPNYNYDDLMEWYGIKTKNRNSINFIPLNKGNSNIKIAELLHEKLTTGGYIEAPLHQFDCHFSSYTSKPSSIKWLGTEIQIVALISLLIENNIISKSMLYKKPSIIINHFINRNGKEFKKRQLSVKQSQFSNDESHHLFTDISQIVNQLAEIN